MSQPCSSFVHRWDSAMCWTCGQEHGPGRTPADPDPRDARIEELQSIVDGLRERLEKSEHGEEWRDARIAELEHQNAALTRERDHLRGRVVILSVAARELLEKLVRLFEAYPPQMRVGMTTALKELRDNLGIG